MFCFLSVTPITLPAAYAADPVTTLYFRTNPGAVNPPLYLSTTQGAVPVADTFANVNGMTSNGQLKDFTAPLSSAINVASATFVVNLANNGNTETLDITAVLTQNGNTIGTATLAGQAISGAGAQKQFTINVMNVNTKLNSGDTINCGVSIQNVFDTFKGQAATADTIQLIYNGNAPQNKNASLCQINADVAVTVPEFGGSLLIAVALGAVLLVALKQLRVAGRGKLIPSSVYQV